MGNEQTTAEERPTAQSTRLATQNCRCGQQLDICGRAHCPRCGRSLEHL